MHVHLRDEARVVVVITTHRGAAPDGAESAVYVSSSSSATWSSRLTGQQHRTEEESVVYVSSSSSSTSSQASSGIVSGEQQEPFVPQTASLMRTGTGLRQNSRTQVHVIRSSARIILFLECCSRCRFQPSTTASSSASRSRFSPPSYFVNGHVSTMCCVVCRRPQSQEGDWARPQLCKLARHGP